MSDQLDTKRQLKGKRKKDTVSTVSPHRYERLNLVFVTDRYFPHIGGVTEHTRGLAHECARLGAKVKVVCTEPRNHGSDTLDSASAENPSVKRVSECSLGNKLLRRVFKTQRLYSPLMNVCLVGLRWLRTLPFNIRLMNELMETECDVMVCVNVHGSVGYYCYLARRLRDFRLVIVPCLHPTKPGGVLEPERKLLRAADGLAVSTNYEKDILIHMGIKERNISVIGPGVAFCMPNKTNGRLFREKLSIGEKQPIVTFLGRMDCGKGINTLIEAVKYARQSRPDIQLVIAGVLGNYRVEDHPYWKKGNKDGEDRNILLFNVTDDEKDSLLNASNILSLVSKFESFGLVLAESWLREKPVIAADHGALAEVVRDGVDGRLVPVDNPEALSLAILEFINDEEKSISFGRAGRQKVVESYLWDIIGKKFYQFCQASSCKEFISESQAAMEFLI